jgi:hypothetical protein
LPKRLYGSIVLFAVLAAVMMACGFGPAADTSAGPPATATDTTAPAATDTPVAPTPTNVPATPTPIPPLKSQIITKTLGSIAPGANSPIVDIACPSGYLVAGGGPKSGYSNFTMMWNAPLNATTWQAEAYNDGTGAINVDVQVVCLAVSGLHSQIITKSLGNISSGTYSPITNTSCPAGYLVAGSGPNSGYPNFTLMWNAPLTTATTRSEAYNDNSSGSIFVQMQIVCLKH